MKARRWHGSHAYMWRQYFCLEDVVCILVQTALSLAYACIACSQIAAGTSSCHRCQQGVNCARRHAGNSTDLPSWSWSSCRPAGPNQCTCVHACATHHRRQWRHDESSLIISIYTVPLKRSIEHLTVHGSSEAWKLHVHIFQQNIKCCFDWKVSSIPGPARPAPWWHWQCQLACSTIAGTW